MRGKADVTDIAFFVDTEVIQGGPLLEVAGHGREASPGTARLL
jgi:hypothetical protein